MQILGLALGNANFHILDTNMLVSPTQNAGVGGIVQRRPQRQVFCVLVEYRLKERYKDNYSHINMFLSLLRF